MYAGDSDLGSYWMPFTANRQFKVAPRLLVSARDMHFTTHDGRKVLDGVDYLVPPSGSRPANWISHRRSRWGIRCSSN